MACKEENRYILERTDSFLKSQMVYFKESSAAKESIVPFGGDTLFKENATKYTLDEAMTVARCLKKAWGDHYKVVRYT